MRPRSIRETSDGDRPAARPTAVTDRPAATRASRRSEQVRTRSLVAIRRPRSPGRSRVVMPTSVPEGHIADLPGDPATGDGGPPCCMSRLNDPRSQRSAFLRHPACAACDVGRLGDRMVASGDGWCGACTSAGRGHGRHLTHPPVIGYGRRVSDSVDLVISGGTIVDGTGAPGDPASVVVEGDRLRIVRGPSSAAGEPTGRSIDAAGLVVAPGFIDLHSHGGLMLLAEPRHEPKVRQGVTTEVIGVDGNAFAPFARATGPRATSSASTPASTASPTSTTTGTTGRELPRALRPARSSLQHRVPRSATRSCGSTPSAGTTCPPTRTRWTACARCSARAWRRARSASRPGWTTRRARTRRPRSSPTLTSEAGRHGGFYHTHVRYPLGDRFLDPFREAIEIGRRAEAPEPHHPLLPPRDASPAGPSDARAGRRRPRRGPRRDLRRVSVEWASARGC